MFKTFSVAAAKTLALGTSAHPVMEHVTSMYAKLVPGLKGKYYYVRFKEIDLVATFRTSDHSWQLHNVGFEEFKTLVSEGGMENLPESPFEIEDCQDGEKHIGNALMRVYEYDVKSILEEKA